MSTFALIATSSVLLLSAQASATTDTDRLAALSLLSGLLAAILPALSQRSLMFLARALAMIASLACAVLLPLATEAKGPGATLLRGVGEAAINANVLAYITVPGIAASLAFATTYHRVSVPFLLVALAGLFAQVLLGSRASLLAITAVVTVAAFAERRHRWWMLGASSVLVVAVGSIAISDSLRSRLLLWQAILALDANPVFGLGYGGLTHFQQTQNAILVNLVPPSNAHNALVQAYVDFGLPGVTLIVAVLSWAVVASIRRLRSLDDDQRTLARAVLFALVAFAVTSSAESTFETSVIIGAVATTVVSPILFILLAFVPSRGSRRMTTGEVNAVPK